MKQLDDDVSAKRWYQNKNCLYQLDIQLDPYHSQNIWVSSPKDTVFPETIPEESSGAEDEHVVSIQNKQPLLMPTLFDKIIEWMYQMIFRLPSLSESEKALDGVRKVSNCFYLGSGAIITSRHRFADFYKFTWSSKGAKVHRNLQI